jgi:hypothetical protein
MPALEPAGPASTLPPRKERLQVDEEERRDAKETERRKGEGKGRGKGKDKAKEKRNGSDRRGVAER